MVCVVIFQHLANFLYLGVLFDRQYLVIVKVATRDIWGFCFPTQVLCRSGRHFDFVTIAYTEGPMYPIPKNQNLPLWISVVYLRHRFITNEKCLARMSSSSQLIC